MLASLPPSLLQTPPAREAGPSTTLLRHRPECSEMPTDCPQPQLCCHLGREGGHARLQRPGRPRPPPALRSEPGSAAAGPSQTEMTGPDAQSWLLLFPGPRPRDFSSSQKTSSWAESQGVTQRQHSACLLLSPGHEGWEQNTAPTVATQRPVQAPQVVRELQHKGAKGAAPAPGAAPPPPRQCHLVRAMPPGSPCSPGLLTATLSCPPLCAATGPVPPPQRGPLT